MEKVINTITREEVVKEIERRGYKVRTEDIVKNGVVKQGIVFNTGTNISPTVYVDDFADKSLTVEEVADECIRIFEDSKRNVGGSVNTSRLLDPDYIKDNCYIGLQKSSDEDIVKDSTEFDGIEQYVYVRVESMIRDYVGSAKISSKMLEAIKLSKEELFSNAISNTIGETSMNSLSEMFGLPDMGVCILSNKHGIKGASAILDKNALKKYGDKHKVSKVVAIPSSIHEWLLMPYSDTMNIEELGEMIKEINGTDIKPEEQLADHAYVIEV